jgi:DNA-binding MarR family transcriptional regulator
LAVKRKREDVEAALTREWRWAQNRTDAHDEVVANALGINRTDLRCLDVLDQEGPTTAGRLAELMGLTTGATTALIDRLEESGFVQRTRDPDDRRRIYVEVTRAAQERAWPYYEPLFRLSAELYGRYTVAQLEIVLDFLEAGAELSRQVLAELRERQALNEQAPT